MEDATRAAEEARASLEQFHEWQQGERPNWERSAATTADVFRRLWGGREGADAGQISDWEDQGRLAAEPLQHVIEGFVEEMERWHANVTSDLETQMYAMRNLSRGFNWRFGAGSGAQYKMPGEDDGGEGDSLQAGGSGSDAPATVAHRGRVGRSAENFVNDIRTALQNGGLKLGFDAQTNQLFDPQVRNIQNSLSLVRNMMTEIGETGANQHLLPALRAMEQELLRLSTFAGTARSAIQGLADETAVLSAPPEMRDTVRRQQALARMPRMSPDQERQYWQGVRENQLARLNEGNPSEEVRTAAIRAQTLFGERAPQTRMLQAAQRVYGEAASAGVSEAGQLGAAFSRITRNMTPAQVRAVFTSIPGLGRRFETVLSGSEADFNLARARETDGYMREILASRSLYGRIASGAMSPYDYQFAMQAVGHQLGVGTPGAERFMALSRGRQQAEASIDLQRNTMEQQALARAAAQGMEAINRETDAIEAQRQGFRRNTPEFERYTAAQAALRRTQREGDAERYYQTSRNEAAAIVERSRAQLLDNNAMQERTMLIDRWLELANKGEPLLQRDIDGIRERARAQREARQIEQSYAAGWAATQRQFEEMANDHASLVKDSWMTAFNGLENGLRQFITTGKLNFRELARSIIADIAMIQIRAQLSGVFGWLMKSTGSLFNFGNSSNPVSTPDIVHVPTPVPGAAMGGAWVDGVRMMAFGGILDRPTLFQDRHGLAIGGEAGTEAVMPLVKTSSGHLGVRSVGGGGGVNINITMNGNASADPRAQQEQARHIAEQVRRAVKVTLADETRDGKLLARKPAAGTTLSMM